MEIWRSVVKFNAAARKKQAQQIPEDGHNRNSFFLAGITFEEKLPYLELADKFCGKFKNLVFLILIMWYTWHGMNLLTVWLFLAIQLYHASRVCTFLSANVLNFQGSSHQMVWEVWVNNQK